MKKRNTFFSILFCLLLVFQLTGCSLLSPEKSSEPKNPTETTEEYQYYDKSDEISLKAQKEFDEFTNSVFCDLANSSDLYLHLLLKNPEKYGITATDSLLGEFSLIQMQESMEELHSIQSRLSEFPYNRLTSSQQFLYSVLNDNLENELSSEGLELYFQPLSESIGIQANLPVLFSEYSLTSKDDIDQYFTLLKAVPGLFQEIMIFERQKVDAGLGPCDATIDRIIESCQASMTTPAGNPLTETFESRLQEIPELTDEEKEAYMEQNTQAISEYWIPAYQKLIEDLTSLKGQSTNSGGLSGFPDGKAYYKYLVMSNSGTTYTMDELYKQIQIQLDSDLRTISHLISENPDLNEQIRSYRFSATEPEDILKNLKSEMIADFPETPKGLGNLTLKYVPKSLETSLSPAFFLIPPIDDYQNTTIYINQKSIHPSNPLYSTLAHEGLPGHLYQTLYFMQKNPSPLLRMLACSGYTEGWATYAEYYSYSFENGLDPNLQQLLSTNSAAILGLYALLDFNINYNGWTKEDTTKYLNSHYSITDRTVADDIFYTLVDCPSNYLQYYTGYLEIKAMKKQAIETLGDNFDIKAFHTFILDMAPASFRVIRQYFNSWILSQQA